MLGVHPEMYALPEVNLFCADTLGQLFDEAREKRINFMTHGLLRVLAQLHDEAQTEDTIANAQAWVATHRPWRIGRVYRHICDLAAPKRCVDKSPPYARAEHMKRLRETFPNALFLHLGRHPRSACLSTFKARSERAQRRNNQLDPSTIEQYWSDTHRAILELATTVPDGHYMYMQGESLLSDPLHYLPQIAEWLGISSAPASIEAMLHPENSPYSCVGPDNARGGNNSGFLQAPQLRSGPIAMPSMEGRLDWFPEGEDHEFRAETREIAAMLGYY